MSVRLESKERAHYVLHVLAGEGGVFLTNSAATIWVPGDLLHRLSDACREARVGASRG